MTPQTAIDTAVSQVVASSHPSRIIMFGSRAQGTETADSDLDILVIERLPRKKKSRNGAAFPAPLFIGRFARGRSSMKRPTDLFFGHRPATFLTTFLTLVSREGMGYNDFAAWRIP